MATAKPRKKTSPAAVKQPSAKPRKKTSPAAVEPAASTYNIDKQWFLDLMATHELSATQVSKVVGVDKSALSLVLSGKRRLKNEEAAKLALHLGVSLVDVLAHAGVDLRGVGRPTISVPVPSGHVFRLDIPPGVTPKDWAIASPFVAKYIEANQNEGGKS